jgi:hypothetical protein
MNSDDGVVTNAFAAKLAAARARHNSNAPAVPETPATEQPEVNPEDVPDVDLSYTVSPEDQALDDAIANLGIIEAYNRWCKKMVPNANKRSKDGIMISCPDPDHPDQHPSAWVNTVKNVYYCPGCDVGGDVWDIAAYFFGYAVPGYKKDPETFRQLRKFIALDLGFTFVVGANQTYVVPPEDANANTETDDATQATSVADAEQVPTTTEPTQESASPEEVGKLPSAVEQELAKEAYEELQRSGHEIPWREIVPENTFLREWLIATTVDNCPEEYHFWTGLMAVGFAIGRDKTLWDLRPVVGNLYTCLVGPSGAGKSRAKEHLSDVVYRVLKWDANTYTGVKQIKAPGSAEYLIKAFDEREDDLSVPGTTIPKPVRGLIDFEELSSLVAVSGRIGSALKPQLMDIYDARQLISSGSLGTGMREALNPFGQAISTTQTEALRKLLDRGDDTSGFLNRWIFASGKLKPPIALGGTQVTLDVPAEFLNRIYVWAAGNPSVIEWTPQAEDLWREFFMATLHPDKIKNEEQGSAMLGRLDLLMKKLILLFSANMHCDIVPVGAVEQAIQVYPYLLSVYGVVHTQIERTDDSDLVEKVLATITKLTTANKREPTRRDVYQCIRKSVKTVKTLEDIMKSLVSLGVLEELAPSKGGRGQPAVRYRVATS